MGQKATLIPKSLIEVEKVLEPMLGMEKSFDVGCRKLQVMNRQVQLYYVTGLLDSVLVVELMSQLLLLNDLKSDEKDVFGVIHNRLVHQQVNIVDNIEEACTEILSGLIVIFLDEEDQAFVVDVRSYPGRGPSEPDTEKAVRGSRDGYTENIIINTALTRRRIRTGKLKNEIYKVGTDSKTDVALMYIEDLADPKIVNEIRERIQEVEVDNLTMTDKELEEFITRQVYNPYPLVRYTERPDVVATHLYQGQVAILVDTSPSVILAPITLFDHLTGVEEYRQTPAVGTFLRLIRFGGILMSVLMMPTWLLFVLHPEYLPSHLSFIGPQEEGNLSIIFQVIVGELGIEFIRMAAIHSPSAISSALGIVSAILIGEVAVKIGLFGPEILFYVAIGTLGGFVTPSYELGLANKMFKMFIILGVVVLGLWGYIGAIMIGLLYLVTLKSFGKPYLYPLFPFNFHDLFKTIVRVPCPYQYKRRKIIRQKRDE